MSASDTLRSIGPSCLGTVIIAVLCAGVLMVAGVSAPVAILVCAIVVGCGALIIVREAVRRRSFLEDLSDLVDGGADPAWFGELVERPDYPEGRVTFDAIQALSKAASDDVAASRRQISDYREYVETWVHEAKSPLSAAHLMLENLRDDISQVKMGEDDRFALMGRASALDEELDRTEGYIEQALFYARSETLDRDYLVREYPLRELVTNAVRSSSRQLIDAHMKPELANLDLAVFTDEKWMAFVLGQVIQNSVKYAREGGGTIAFTGKTVGSGTAGERVELEVRDDGPGVSAEDLPRVFDRGFTGAAGRTGKRSTGIGLYLVKRLCDKMGISVTAASAPGEGFAVTFGFPTNKFHYFER